MAFKEDKTPRQLEDSILGYLGITREDLVQSWEEHVASVDAKEEEELPDGNDELTYVEHRRAAETSSEDTTLTINGLALNSLTRIGKLDVILNATLDNLATGALALETGEELLATTQAVAIMEQLSA